MEYVTFEAWCEAPMGTLIASYNDETITELYIKVTETMAQQVYDNWDILETEPTKLYLSSVDSFTDYELSEGKCFVDKELQELVYDIE